MSPLWIKLRKPKHKHNISDCPDVAKVAKDGTVTAKSEGKTIIYIQEIGGKWCQVEVTVKEK